MKTFPVRGGIHPEYRKELTGELAIERLPLPERLYIPLQQHIGAPAEVLVQAGDLVAKGQVIARRQGNISVHHHASTSGQVVEVTEIPAPHPTGLPQATVVIAPDGQDVWGVLPAPIADPFAASPQAIAERVAESGIVGMGGATFPAAVKLNLGIQYRIETLLLNGAECEPYLTCDDRVMREYTDEVVDGARIMAHALGAARIVIAIEDNKPQALEKITAAAAAFPEITVTPVPVKYPMGSERHLTFAITGRETPARKLTADIGVVVHNVATARAVHQAVRFGRPLVSRVVTVSGQAIAQPKNIEAPIGARVSDLIEFCGGFSQPPERMVQGGPMMGSPLPGLDVPVVKGTSGILALTALEINDRPSDPCIRCGSCVAICACGLTPVEIAARIRHDDLDGAVKLGVMDCVSCGSCSWVCPSHIPLVHYFNYAKGAVNAKARVDQKTERTKTLAEAHNARLERLAAQRAASRKPKAAAAATDEAGA
ncbi:electron transport complex subunit RsxC [Rhodoferax sp. 4810]|uniref:Ion-translocating oxidoreductase complex subunit C n=1 Tax=Thiospirillum jenense TaxID=1653858 RepID=A0A839HEZ6_9GAMM|nr:electron transport complex subunit RsxC [Thiospirillum jenense]MBB1073932.1 electron transport complex subunit RsxC [Rhodoferax jenense]MBB1125808.1 electron transport complex subunit RsxC [Thiospirillum jenense]